MNKVPVTARALVQRINRKLKGNHELLKATRGDRWRDQLGDYYIVNERMNAIIRKHVDLEMLGRRIGALGKFEQLKD